MIKYQINYTSSYQRPDMLVQKTLKTLKDHNIDPKIITVFVNNQSQFNQYSEVIPKFNV